MDLGIDDLHRRADDALAAIFIGDLGFHEFLRGAVVKRLDQLAIALKGADELVREKVFSNMSKRSKEMLVEDMESRGPTKLSDVEEAQKNILAAAKQLADDGKISLGGSSDDYV